MTFVMQPYSLIVDKTQTYDDLKNPGSKLKVPKRLEVPYGDSDEGSFGEWHHG